MKILSCHLTLRIFWNTKLRVWGIFVFPQENLFGQIDTFKLTFAVFFNAVSVQTIFLLLLRLLIEDEPWKTLRNVESIRENYLKQK